MSFYFGFIETNNGGGPVATTKLLLTLCWIVDHTFEELEFKSTLVISKLEKVVASWS